MNIFFKKQFVPLILDGTKIHTIRIGSRIREGQSLQFRTGSRFKSVLFYEAQAVKVIPIRLKIVNALTLDVTDTRDDSLIVPLNNPKKRLQFIKNDGFENVEDFTNFFFPRGFVAATIMANLIFWKDFDYS